MDFTELKAIIKSININHLMKVFFSSNAGKAKVIQLNQNQLYQKGIDAKGKVIKTYFAHSPNVYSNQTINIKREKGQKSNIVTLKDTGEFYRSFKSTADEEGINIEAEFNKQNGNIANNVDITNILGLTDYNIDRISKDMVIPIIQLELRKAMLGI